MKHTPSYQLSILQEATFSEEMATVAAQLAACRQEGSFCGFDGKELYYEYFQVQESRGAIVLVHGLSEFTGKYHEFAWYLLNQGYDVFLYDQRSHGRSCRLTPHLDLIHVGAFSHYRKDLDCFINQVVRKATDKPLYLFGHSMGGAVAIQYMAKNPGVFQKAVLSAPMIEPITGSVSPRVARWGLAAYLLVGAGKKKFWGSEEFDPDYPFSRSQDRSFARFRRNMEVRLTDPRLCTTPLTIGWIQQSVSLRGKLTSKRFLKKIRTPVRVLCAEVDRVVSGKAQEDFVKNCPNCQRVVIPESTHSLLWGTSEQIGVYVQQVLDHFS